MPAEIEQAAREMGWRPQEEFRGDPTKWVNAEEFVSRGENFIPILRKDRELLRGENAAIKQRLDETAEALRVSQEAIAELKVFHTEDTQRQVERARKDLVKQLAAAREAGDVEGEVAIQDQLAEIRQATPKPTAAPPAATAAPAAPAPPAADPIQTAWIAGNPWFAESPRLRGLALGIAEELRAKDKSLVGQPFYDRISEEMADYLDPPATNRPTSKVGGGRGSPSQGGLNRAKTYADLPAEAKAACSDWTRKLVGPNKAYKDEAAWQAEYTRSYFAGETA